MPFERSDKTGRQPFILGKREYVFDPDRILLETEHSHPYEVVMGGETVAWCSNLLLAEQTCRREWRAPGEEGKVKPLPQVRVKGETRYVLDPLKVVLVGRNGAVGPMER